MFNIVTVISNFFFEVTNPIYILRWLDTKIITMEDIFFFSVPSFNLRFISQIVLLSSLSIICKVIFSVKTRLTRVILRFRVLIIIVLTRLWWIWYFTFFSKGKISNSPSNNVGGQSLNIIKIDRVVRKKKGPTDWY